ncbi:MAG: SAM-dependent chlorinase/fluorinase [Elusimicrobia bacterium]|nr:SAM-dependent chlorinase/fluorinase [Elusimicrobiota bacterium]
MKKINCVLIFAVALFMGFNAHAAGNKNSFVLFLSDFGTKDDSAAQCKGVILSINPETQVIDLTHEIPPFDINFASFLLYDSSKVWPAGSIFLAVVDPGVGTARNPILLETMSGHYFIGPDNGIFTLAAKKLGVKRITLLENKKYFRGNPASTFHGRDVFASAAGWLSRRGFDPAELGGRLPKIIFLDLKEAIVSTAAVTGRVMRIEAPYGNVLTNIGEDDVRKAGLAPGSTLHLETQGKELALPFKTAFGEVEQGKPLAYINSRGYLSLAVNMGDFAAAYGIKAGAAVRLLKKW